MIGFEVEELKSIAALSYEQKRGVEAAADLIKTKTAYLTALKGVNVKVLKEARKREINRAPYWITLWGVYFTAWIFLLMIVRANIYPR